MIAPPRRLLVAVLLLCAVPAVGRELPQVKEIRVEGLLRIPEESARAKMRSRTGSPLEPSVVSEDIKRLFAMKAFEDIKVGVKEVEGGVILLFLFKERPTINKITIEGNDDVDEDDIRKVVDLRPFEIVDVERIKRNISKIQDVYNEEGFYLADIQYKLVPLKNNLVNMVFLIEEGQKIKVKTITFVGNKKLPDDELKGVMQTREGGWFSFLTGSGAFKKATLDQDITRVFFYYWHKGYIKAQVKPPVVSLSPDKKAMDITVFVEEGDPYKVTSVDVKGELEPFEKAELTKVVKITPGMTFDFLLVQQDSQRIARKYKDKGYANCTVSYTRIEGKADLTVDFAFEVQKGRTVHVGKIGIEGNETTRDKVIRRMMAIAEGDLYNETQVQKSQREVMRLGFFEKVEISSDPGASADFVNLTVKVKERQTGTFQIGAGFSSLESFIATAQISKQNFLGHGQTLSFQATISSIRSLYTISFFEPYFLDTDWTLSVDLYNFQQDFDDFTRGALGGELSFGYRFTPDLHLSLGYKLENVEITIGGLRGRSTIPIANLFNDGLTSSLKTTLTYDTRNDRMFPSAGQFTTGSAEIAHAYLGSDSEFLRLLARTRWYFNPFWKVVLKLNATVGYVTPISADRQVPIFERFFVGGIFDVRGYQRFSLGPQLAVASEREPGTTLTPFNVGGNKKLVFNVELEIPILPPPVGIRGVIFFDAGKAYNDDELFDPRNMFFSVGFGFRWFSPVGPLRFEWGIPLNPRPQDDPIVFEFTIGNSF